MRIADPCDQAAAASELMLKHSLQHRKPTAPGATGYCLMCYEPLEGDRRWCDAECRDYWEKEHESCTNK